MGCNKLKQKGSKGGNLFEDSLYLFGGNPGGAVLSRFNDFWKLEIVKADDYANDLLNILRITEFYNLLETNKLPQACLFLRSSKCANLTLKVHSKYTTHTHIVHRKRKN